MNKKIFISYSWSDSKIVDIIDNDFSSIGISLIRDQRDAKNYESLTIFMKKIRNADFVIHVISESYLKSLNCMFEVNELTKDNDFDKKIFPIIIKKENFNIYSLNSSVEFINYWENKYKKFQNKISKIENESFKKEPLERLKTLHDICKSIGNFIKVIQDKKSPSLDELRKSNYKPILDKIGFENLVSNIIVELIKIQKMKNREEQDLLLDKLLKKYPKNKYIYFCKADIEGNRGEYNNAIINYSNAIKIDTTYVDPYIKRGVIYGKQYEENGNQQDFISAKENLEKAKELGPQYIEIYNNLGILYRLHENYELAEKELTTALKMNPYFIPAYNNRGIVYERQKLFDKAIEDYTYAIKINPNYPKAYENRGIVFSQQKKYELAEKDFNKAIEIDPDNAGTYFNRGKLYLELEKFDLWKKDFNKANELDPNYINNHTNHISF